MQSIPIITVLAIFCTSVTSLYLAHWFIPSSLPELKSKLRGNNQNYCLSDDDTHVFASVAEPNMLMIKPLEGGDITITCLNAYLATSKMDTYNEFKTSNIPYYCPYHGSNTSITSAVRQHNCNVSEIELISDLLCLNNNPFQIVNRKLRFIVDNSNNHLLETLHGVYFDGYYEIPSSRMTLCPDDKMHLFYFSDECFGTSWSMLADNIIIFLYFASRNYMNKDIQWQTFMDIMDALPQIIMFLHYQFNIVHKSNFICKIAMYMCCVYFVHSIYSTIIKETNAIFMK